MILHKTRGIVLKTVKYGETSIIVSIYTELWGIQSYMVNGVRTSSKKGSGRANLFQPASILDLVVYHNELKNLQRIKEFRLARPCQSIFYDVMKNAVALYMVELLQKCLKQPEANPDLFYFIEDAFLYLDNGEKTVVANYPLFFIVHLASFFGFRLQDDYSEEKSILDLREGRFVGDHPMHHHSLEGQSSYLTSQLLKIRMPRELKQLQLTRELRGTLLHAYQAFYAYHIQDFGLMKTLPVLQAILS